MLAGLAAAALAVWACASTTPRPLRADFATPCAEADCYAFVVNRDSANVSVVNTAERYVTTTIAIQVGGSHIVASPAGGHVWALSTQGGALTLIDVPTQQSIRTTPLGTSGDRAVMNPNGRFVYVADYYSDQVLSAATEDGAVARQTVGINPGLPVCSPDGSRLYVPITGESALRVLDAETLAVTGTVAFASGPAMAAVHPNGSRLYVSLPAEGAICAVNTANGSVQQRGAVTGNPLWMAVPPDGTRVFVGVLGSTGGRRVQFFQESTLTTLGTTSLGAGPEHFSMTADGARIVSAGGDRVRIVDSALRAIVATVGVPSGALWPAVSRDGARAYVPCATAGELAFVDVRNGLLEEVVAVGAAPVSVVLAP